MVEKKETYDPNRYLNISTLLWKKDTLDLFDFESNDIIFQEFKISKDNLIIKDPSSYSILMTDSIKGKTDSVYCKVMKSNDNFILASGTERLWSVIGHRENYSLGVGEVLKLGRVRLKFDRIYTRNYLQDNTSQEKSNIKFQNLVLQTPKA